MRELDTHKLQLRSQMRQRRRAISSEEQQLAALHLITSVKQLPGWGEANTIALYFASDGEIDTAPLIESSRQEGKRILLPVVGKSTMAFAVWQETDQLQKNHFAIPEPPVTAERINPRDIDVICLPLVAWDRQGGRLGMGGGFYDRTVAEVVGPSQAGPNLAGPNLAGPKLLGLGHSCQEDGDIPMADWDVRVQFVATENGLIHCQK
jgi:5-formyltetrahydrofolate cyclo-ligase